MEDAGTSVISVGANPELIWLRNFVLQSAGFRVISTTDAPDALARIKRRECGVLIMCYSLAVSAMQTLAEAVKEFCPGSRTLLITNERTEKPEFADALVYGMDGPEALIDAINAFVADKSEERAQA